MREIRSFVVRLYRRSTQGLAGVVEDVQTGCVHTFHTAEDLWQVLSAGPNKEERKPK
jgi:hypothetical protein